MAKLSISKSIQIDAPVEKVYQTVNDFNHWTAWSPWLIMEPEVQTEVSDDAKHYSWEGERVGSGNMTVLQETTNESVDYDLLFLKPWKSKAKIRFEMEPQGEGTQVRWLMDSKLPFYLFWMKKSMTAFIGMDYERGLHLLKDYVEDGEVHSDLDFKGFGNYPGCTYIGLQTVTAIKNVGPKMREDFTKIEDYLKDQKDLIDGNSFSIYHKWDMVKDQVRYTAGVPVKNIPQDLPDTMVSGTIPATRVYTLRHTGPYLHLGNAWSALNSMHRNKEFKMNKKIDPFEVYINLPGEVSENELITDIHFPVKD